jgi:hypothetical protein
MMVDKYNLSLFNEIKNAELPKINMNNDNEAVLIYFGNSTNIEFHIKQTILSLGKNWSHTVLCGNDNYFFLLKICKNISKNVKLIQLNYNSINELILGNFLYNEEFWNLFVGEKLLFYNENYLLGNESINYYFNKNIVSSLIYKDVHNVLPFGDFCLCNKKFIINNMYSIINHLCSIDFLCYEQNQNDCYLTIYKPWNFNSNKNVLHNHDKSNDFFNPVHYKVLNIDLQHMDRDELLSHFKFYGYKEKRKCFISDVKMQNLIKKYCIFEENFSSCHYKALNDDLKNITSLELIKHYNFYGRNENRITYIEDFPYNPQHYRLLNYDLRNMPLHELICHYNNHGKYENRSVCIANFDNANHLIGNCVIFINHASELSGAPIFLYDFVVYLQENNVFENIIIFDVIYDEKLEQKYYNRLKIKPIYYFQNYALLNELLNHYNPIFIYSNSMNYLNRHTKKFSTEIIQKTIFHFHETTDHINVNHDNLKLNKKFVVSDNIKKQLLEKTNDFNISIFTPFLAKDKLEEINNNINDKSINHIFDSKRIVFAMCGTQDSRKGYDIFINIARNMPQHDFIWIGGEYDSTNPLNNFTQICNTKNPYKYINKIDYLLVTSRSDPCPYVILEALYLNIPCIVLDKNITYEHTVNVNYYVIKDHENDYNNIIHYLQNNIALKKNTHCNSKDYILENFSSPLILKEKKEKNNIVLIAALRITREEDFGFFKNLMNYIKIINDTSIDIVIVIMTDHIYNNNQTFIHKENYTLFGISPSAFDISKYQKQMNLPHKKIIFCPNRGYDVGPMMIGLKFCEKMNYNYVLHIHSKYNKSWRNSLLKICNHNINTVNCDTIICKDFFSSYTQNDYNSKILNYYNKLFPTNNVKKWNFNGGKMFATRFSFLKPLIRNFSKIYGILTDVNKNDVYWQKIMLNKDFFNKQYNHYKNDFLNVPISENAQQIMIETKSKNFFELLSHGAKGIPDCQIEHALERYIGFLTINNKNVLKV